MEATTITTTNTTTCWWFNCKRKSVNYRTGNCSVSKKIPGQRTDQLICLSHSEFNTRNKMPQELLTHI